MPSSPSTNLRLEEQATGENLNSWGTRLNTAIELIEEALVGKYTKSLTTDYTLVATNYVSDQARPMALFFTDGGLASAPTVTIPSVKKLYLVHNGGSTYSVIMSCGGTTASVRAGQLSWIYCDGTDVYITDATLDKINAPTASVSLNSQKITSLATPTADTDASTKAYVDDNITLARDATLRWNFASSTTMADPSTGNIRFDNATLSSVTNLAISANMSLTGNPSVYAYLATWDDSSSVTRGHIIVRKISAPQNFAIFKIATVLTDNTTWVQIPVTYISGSGSFSASDAVSVTFYRTGDAGSSDGDMVKAVYDTNNDGYIDVAAGGTGVGSVSAFKTAFSFGTAGNYDRDTDGTMATNSDSLIPSQKAVRTYVDALLGLTRSARTSNTILGIADNGKLIEFTSGTFTQTFTAAATLGAGWTCYVYNSGSGDITLDPNSTETIDGVTSFIMYPGEARLVQCDGTAFHTLVLKSFYREWTATATGGFTVPPGYQRLEGLLWGGGGSGAVQSGTNSGGGGGGGACVPVKKRASSVGSPGTAVDVTIGAGGIAVTGVSAGNGGGNSVFSSVTAYGGGAGQSNGNGGGGGGALSAASGRTGGNPNGGTGTLDNDGFGGAPGGGGGAGLNSGWGGAGAGGGSGGVAGAGGSSVYGGAAGAGHSSGSTASGGTSIYGGAGGASAVSGTATSGSAPGGGGGSCGTSGTSGAGARGELRLWGII